MDNTLPFAKCGVNGCSRFIVKGHACPKHGATMKTQLVLAGHELVPGSNIVEIWYDGKFIGTVIGSDSPGVRIISKYPMEYRPVDPMICEVTISS